MENKLTSVGFTGSEITTGINGSVIEDEDAIDGSGSLDYNMVLEEITTKDTLNTNFGLLEEKQVDESLGNTANEEIYDSVARIDEIVTAPKVSVKTDALDSISSSQCAAMEDVVDTMFPEDVHDSSSEDMVEHKEHIRKEHHNVKIEKA